MEKTDFIKDDIEVIGASENNLKHVDVTIPKGKLVMFAGVSGSGKSSLAFDTIAVESSREWQQSYPLFLRNKMPHYDRPKVDEIRNLTPAIIVDQHAIGATSRSTVGTAVDVAPLMRLLFSRVGVPASKTSVGIIMRRRLRMRTELLPPLETPDALTIFVAYYFSAAYPVVLGLYGDRVRLIDVLSESSESAYAVFFTGLDKSKVKQVFIDPDEQLHSAVNAAFPDAKIMMSEECIQRYIRDAFKDVIKKDGSRCFIHQRYHTLCKPESYLSDYEHRQVANTLRRRHRLGAAYNAYQELLHSMTSGWDIPRVIGWIDDLPDYLSDYADEGETLDALREFDIIKTVLQLYESQVKSYLALQEKPPAAMPSAVMSIMDSLDEMPFCIYDILHARMLLNVEHDWILKEGTKYRIGVPVERLTERMHEITTTIKRKKENEENGYEPED